MPTTIINIKTGAKYDIYCGRARKGQPENILGNNKFIIGIDGNRDEVCNKFDEDAEERYNSDPEFRKAVDNCKNRILGCFCKPQRCHCDWYVRKVGG